MSPRTLQNVTTERMVLEALGPEHADALRPLLDDPRVARTLSPTGRPPAPGAEPEQLAVKADHWERYGFGLWLLRDRHSGALIGRGGLQHTTIEGRDEVEIAWAIVPERWRQGLATELARTCVETAFGHLGRPDVIAITLPDNLASRRVMTKVGMAYERNISHLGLPHVLYRLSARTASGVAG